MADGYGDSPRRHRVRERLGVRDDLPRRRTARTCDRLYAPARRRERAGRRLRLRDRSAALWRSGLHARDEEVAIAPVRTHAGDAERCAAAALRAGGEWRRDLWLRGGFR